MNKKELRHDTLLPPLEYKIDQASETEIRRHLDTCKDLFIPSLTIESRLLSDSFSSWIQKYSAKIRKNAKTFEIWDNLNLVGLVACYLNDLETKTGFITNVSIEKKHARKGLASFLLKKCLEYADSIDFKTIELEVDAKNLNALKLYENFGFTKVSSASEKLKLIYYFKT